MARTISSAFQKFKENLEITGFQESTVSTRQNNVRDVVKHGMEVRDSFLTGSYRRNTMIAPLKEADVDIFIILHEKYFYNYDNNQNGGQAALLDLVKSTLKKIYTRTPEINRNGQAVTITFEDFIVDVVPAFNRQGGGYLIPNSNTKTWIATNPKIHVDIMSDTNLNHKGSLIPIVKMIKAWNKNNDKAFVSFYLELLAMKIFTNVTISDFPSGVRFFLDKGREAIKYTVKDPVEYGGYIEGFRNIKTVTDAVNKFEISYKQAINAENYAAKGNIAQAIEEWRKIFGNYFPAYG